jgi:hypothetical protein
MRRSPPPLEAFIYKRIRAAASVTRFGVTRVLDALADAARQHPTPRDLPSRPRISEKLCSKDASIVTVLTDLESPKGESDSVPGTGKALSH